METHKNVFLRTSAPALLPAGGEGTSEKLMLADPDCWTAPPLVAVLSTQPRRMGHVEGVPAAGEDRRAIPLGLGSQASPGPGPLPLVEGGSQGTVDSP